MGGLLFVQIFLCSSDNALNRLVTLVTSLTRSSNAKFGRQCGDFAAVLQSSRVRQAGFKRDFAQHEPLGQTMEDISLTRAETQRQRGKEILDPHKNKQLNLGVVIGPRAF